MALTTIPSVLRPGVYLEVDPNAAASDVPVLPNRILYIGSRLSSGTVAAGVPVQIINDNDGDTYHGVGSQLAGMIERARAATSSGQTLEQWSIGVADAGGAAAAQGDITFTGTSTAAGTLRYRIAGRPIRVAIPSGTAAAAVPALALVEDHSRHPAVPSDATLGVLQFDARNAGEFGNDIDIRVDEVPPGLSAAVTPMAAGATNPTLTSTIAAIAALRPQRIVLGYSDTTSITALVAELVLRAGWQREQFARGFVGYNGTAANCITLAGNYNSEYLSIVCFADGPAPPWEIAAATAMAVASFEDPSANRNGAPISGLPHPELEDRLGASDEESLLAAGVTPLVASDYGDVSILRHVTTYTEDSNGNPDATWRDASKVTTMWACMYTADVRLSQRWKDAKLADDPVTPRPGQKIMSPNRLRSELLIIWDDIWVPQGWVEEARRGDFSDTMQSVRSLTDLTRLDFFVKPDLIDPLNVIAGRFGLAG